MPYIKQVHVLVFDGFADQEIALALSELNRSPRHEVITCGFDRRPVAAMSGLRVIPDIACDDIALERAGLFIIPGGALWEARERNAPFDDITARTTDMLQSFDAAGVRIAGICGATLALARAGLLDGVNHTSNGANYLPELAPGYRSGAFHVNVPAIADENIITANGAAAVEFAHEIIRQLALYDDDDRQLWFRLYKHGEFRRPLAPRQAA